jgi:hypothetical protein
VYHRVRKYDIAQACYYEALEINRAILGEEHPTFANTLNVLADLYIDIEQYSDAELLLRQSMEIIRNTFGEVHRRFVECLTMLGSVHTSKGQYTEAETLYQRANEIKGTIFGEHHPAFALGLNNLAELYRTMGARDRAEPLYQQALAVFRAHQTINDPDYATVLSNLTLLSEERARFATAARLHRQALAWRRKTLGVDHPDTVRSQKQLAWTRTVNAVLLLGNAWTTMAMTVLALWLPREWGITVLVLRMVWFVIALPMSMRDNWHHHLAVLILSMWLTVIGFSHWGIGAHWSDNRFLHVVGTRLDATVHLIIGSIILTLAALDRRVWSVFRRRGKRQNVP